jgi:hypothetical protein
VATPRASEKKGSKPQQSRLRRYEIDGVTPMLPSKGAAAYLLDYFWDVGPSTSFGMGDVPVSHSELMAWQLNTGVILHPWEVALLRRLSSAYISQVELSRESGCKPPYGQLYRSPNLDSKIDAALD